MRFMLPQTALLAALLMMTAPAGAQLFSPSLDLSTLNGTNGFVLNGIDEFDLSEGDHS